MFRTSSSQEEGGERTFAFRTTHVTGDGKIDTLHGETADGEKIAMPVDTLILALGVTGPDTTAIRAQLGVALDARGNIATDKRGATNIPRVYCAGDAHRGASLIVWAIAEGREIARAIDAELRESPSVVPARGQDRAFDRR